MKIYAVGSTVAMVILGMMAFIFPVDYMQQYSYKTRQYYPATIVDIRPYNSCSKSNCIREYTLNLELDNGTIIRSILVSEDTASQYKLGDTIRMERHITDPEVRFQNAVFGALLVMAVLSGIVSLVCWVTYWLID